ncbi:MAG TPA: glycosyltransferase family 39 protein [Thermoleophilaceae bacterium]|nr:glycosyltransferase family 39 protein [Thermoleophilaceae bacterium]
MIERLRTLLSRLAGAQVARGEVVLLLAAIAAGLAVRVAYVLATHDHTLAGDEPEYYLEGLRATEGKWFWTDRPFDIPHPGMWKSPGYPAWVSAVYLVLGVGVGKLLLLQTVLLGPVVILLLWLLARRLFDSRVAGAAAFVGALYPHMWQWEGRLYPEALALPLGILLLLLVLERVPAPGLAVVVGAVMAASLLVRPTAFFFLPGVAVAWWMAAGLRRGTLMLGLAVLVMVALIAPWTARNYRVANDFIPLSMQDSAAYGTFNDDAANDPRSPYAWRVRTAREEELFNGPPIPDAEFREELQSRALDYIKEHPDSLPKAFFWNGLSRTWDIRRPQYAIDEVGFEGRNEEVSVVGIAIYYVLLAAALVGLWRLRARRTLVFPLLAMALAASVVFTSAAATRYRLPLEPMIVVLACTVLVAFLDRHSGAIVGSRPGRAMTGSRG